MTRLPTRRRGVSLVEALVAMAIMAFGMLAVVGVQSTLRFNSDIAKQRAEATRLAEEVIEAARGFNLVGSGTATDAEFDALADEGPVTVSGPEYNTTYSVVRTVRPEPVAGVRRPSVTVTATVTWRDRQGLDQTVTLRDAISRVDPVLSGMVIAPKALTPVGRRDNRHPTIPPRAHDLGDGTSIFKPNEAGTAAWIFNNATGVITHICVVLATETSDSFTVAPALCTALDNGAHLISGEIRFNLRGTPKDLGDGTSAMKPVDNDNVAWVIDNDTSTVVKRCSTTAAHTADLTPGLLSSCTTISVPITPFATGDDANPLTASDSEDPRWPILPLGVRVFHDPGSFPHTGPGGVPSECFASSQSLSKAAVAIPAGIKAEYFCIVFANAAKTWSGWTTLEPKRFVESASAIWAVGSTDTTYKVCRYTTAANETVLNDNSDHPKKYGKITGCGTSCRPAVQGNLINQNFLVINGAKSCPIDVAANPATGNMVNSNTLVHQE